MHIYLVKIMKMIAMNIQKQIDFTNHIRNIVMTVIKIKRFCRNHYRNRGPFDRRYQLHIKQKLTFCLGIFGKQEKEKEARELVF